MERTSLGLGDRAIADTMLCQVPEVADWDWNSTYWRNLGAPWGGAHADGGDVARLLEYFAHPDSRVLKPDTARAMIVNQTGLPQRWGLGWAVNGSKFGESCSDSTFGHSGSTGTLCWLDPNKDLTFVILTTRPADYSNKALLHPVSDVVSTAA
jgi:CubicO group peptidase (beta-lactamase class C family)